MASLARPRSHWLIVVGCLLAVVVSTTAAVHQEPTASAAAHPKTTGTASPSQAATVNHSLNFGLAYGDTLYGKSQSTIDISLDDAVSLGTKWIRVDLPWGSIEPQAGSGYDWTEFNRIASAAQSRGLKIDAILDDVPQWARESACRTDFSCAPAEDSQFAAFAAAAARHYASYGMNTWEIWNEPNIDAWAPDPDPVAYEKLLAATSTALHKAESSAFVVLGGLAAVPTNASLHRISAFDFLTQVAELGGTKYVNAVGYHPYSLPTMPSASVNFQAISSSTENLESVLQRYGTPNVTIWLNETGAQVDNAYYDATGAQTLTRQQESAQAAYATNLVHTVAANDYVGADFWYSDQDDPGNHLFFGLRRTNGTYRPAFASLKSAIAACGCNSGH